jgi:hypothetical protein
MDETGTSFIDGAQLSSLLPEDGDRSRSPKHCLNKKNMTVDNVQKLNNCIHMLSSTNFQI